MHGHPHAEQLVRADTMIDTVGLTGKADEIWPTLSQGERGRTLIARALIAEPRLLLFDEPSTGLDLAAREQLLETIDTLGDTHPEVASVLVTHHLEELPSSTTHALLIADTPVDDTPSTEPSSRPNRTYAIGALHPMLVGCLLCVSACRDALTAALNVIARTRCRIQPGRSYPRPPRNKPHTYSAYKLCS